MIGINLSKMLPLLREVIFGEDSLNWTRRLTSSAIYALIGVNVEHFCRLKISLVFARVNTIDRTDIHTSRVLCPYAGFRYNVSHLSLSLLSGCALQDDCPNFRRFAKKSQ
jgi:hypothetical protein